MHTDVTITLDGAVISRILLIEDDRDFVPRFTESFLRKGTVVFVSELIDENLAGESSGGTRLWVTGSEGEGGETGGV